VELYLHSLTRLHDLAFDFLRTGTTLSCLQYTQQPSAAELLDETEILIFTDFFTRTNIRTLIRNLRVTACSKFRLLRAAIATLFRAMNG
jgi:hypothetical protein